MQMRPSISEFVGYRRCCDCRNDEEILPLDVKRKIISNGGIKSSTAADTNRNQVEITFLYAAIACGFRAIAFWWHAIASAKFPHP